jgi:hypothetical protein
MFNIMKKKYHKSDTFTFSQLKERLVVEGQVRIVEATPATFRGWDNALKTFYTKFASGTIFKNHIFACNLSAPTTLSIKEWRDAETDVKRNFSKRGTNGADRAELMKLYQLEQLTAPGLREIKQVELWTKWRKFIPHEYQAEICPEPDFEIVQRIKNEKKAKLKLVAAKKKKLSQPTVTAMESEELGTATVMESI